MVVPSDNSRASPEPPTSRKFETLAMTISRAEVVGEPGVALVRALGDVVVVTWTEAWSACGGAVEQPATRLATVHTSIARRHDSNTAAP